MLGCVSYGILALRKTALVTLASSFCLGETATKCGLQLSMWPIGLMIQIKCLEGEAISPAKLKALTFNLQSGYFGGCVISSEHFVCLHVCLLGFGISSRLCSSQRES